jgi:CcmD family protein
MKKKMNKLIAFISLLFVQLNTFAAGTDWTDSFYRDGKYRVVVAILAIIFTGIVVYLVRLDRRISKMEKKSKQS